MNRQARIAGEPVSIGALRAFVLRRDRQCILRKTRFPGHVCRSRFTDQYGGGLASRDDDFSLEHVTQVHSHLEGRVDDDAHCVGLCLATNIKPPSAAERDVMRNELRRMHPLCSQG